MNSNDDELMYKSKYLKYKKKYFRLKQEQKGGFLLNYFLGPRPPIVLYKDGTFYNNDKHGEGLLHYNIQILFSYRSSISFINGHITNVECKEERYNNYGYNNVNSAILYDTSETKFYTYTIIKPQNMDGTIEHKYKLTFNIHYSLEIPSLLSTTFQLEDVTNSHDLTKTTTKIEVTPKKY